MSIFFYKLQYIVFLFTHFNMMNTLYSSLRFKTQYDHVYWYTLDMYRSVLTWYQCRRRQREKKRGRGTYRALLMLIGKEEP